MTIEDLALEYLDLKDTIDELETQQKEVKKQIEVEMETDLVAQTTNHVFPTVEVIRVKGRTTTKLDRTKLVQLGVAGAVLDAATITRTGAKGIRIARPKTQTVTATAPGPSGPA